MIGATMSNNVIIVDKGKPAELTSDSMRSLLTFPHVKLKDRIKFLTATLKDVEEVAGGLQVTVAAVIEAEGGTKPVCVAEPVFRMYGG